MDIQMPVMDGLSATRAIRAELNMTDIPIVAMTAHALDEERQRCVDAGMNDHISKPIDARDVKMKIIKWVGANVQLDVVDEAPSLDSMPILDPTAVDVSAVASRLMLPEDIVRKMLHKFCRDYADAPEKLSLLIQNGNLKAAQSLAHSVKGVSGTLGIDDVYRLFGRLETDIKDGTFDPTAWSEEELTATFSQVVSNIETTVPPPD